MIGCNMRRTRSWFILIASTCLLCLARITICDESQSVKNSGAGAERSKAQETPVASPDKGAVGKNEKKSNAAVTEQPSGKNVTSQSAPKIVNDKSVIETTTLPSEPGKEEFHQPTVNAGALLRAFYVLAGLSVIALAYMVFRSFGLNKQRPQMVRKYGILAHKQDIEMRPLPLDEDDEDDTTVFDVSGLVSSRSHS